ncbi:unnamed protein product [Bursaphelenchus okinawaensis]|uniref:Uncharacterized protein n=1 Tax=Bursaphelenchus okinawaensis TaxID=465554 RepID=A0A811L747_9BILA|nr:unnamed protein product [Bursaphelenchus okinawaensis]CAG9118016.1 unnamed protein product [Bursaphelenchus okinawaensis]
MFGLKWTVLVLSVVWALISSTTANPFLMSRLPSASNRMVYALRTGEYEKRGAPNNNEQFYKRGLDYEDDSLLRFGK